MYRDKSLTRKMYRALMKRCPEGTDVSIECDGGCCVAQRGDRYCSGAVARVRLIGEYSLCYFRSSAGTDAMGEAGAIADAVQAMVCWVEGASVADLHRRFAFVDARMRMLDAIRMNRLHCLHAILLPYSTMNTYSPASTE